MKNKFIIWVAKVAGNAIKYLHLGAGSTWPGEVALQMNSQFLGEQLNNSSLKVILIAGTNGKTTTSTLLRFILEKKGYKVFQNEEGANLMNGIVSSVIKNTDLNGKINFDYAIFEVDENILPLVLKEITPFAILILNLFRDQLDRYGEVNTIAGKWYKSLLDTVYTDKQKRTKVFINGDDPQLYYLGVSDAHLDMVYFFGGPEEILTNKEISHDVDSIYCPLCGTKLHYEKISFSHLGEFSCPKCTFKQTNIKRYSLADLQTNLHGSYNFYNISAVVLFLEQALELSKESLLPYLKEFKPAFGRQEVIQYKGRNIFLILSKNPTGFNQSITAVTELLRDKRGNILILLNDRIPDGRDISWIWDVEFQKVLPSANTLFLSGDRAYDLALRFKYCLDEQNGETVTDEGVTFSNINVIASLPKAVEQLIQNTPENETAFILSTYSAMLETRELLVGKKLL